jgi:hypothetical protein
MGSAGRSATRPTRARTAPCAAADPAYTGLVDLVELLRSQARKYKCVQCGESMADCRINVLAQQGNRALVRVTCTSCKDENLLQIIFQTESELGRAARPRPTMDEGRPVDAPPITADEMLEVHELLNGHAAGFKELLARR